MSLGTKAITGSLYESVMGQVGTRQIEGPLHQPVLGTVGLAPITGRIGIVLAEPVVGDYFYWPVNFWPVGYWPLGFWPK